MRLSIEFSRKNNAAQVVAAATRKGGKRQSEEVNAPMPDRVKMEMDSYRTAVTSARMPENPIFYELRRKYEAALTDSHVRSQIQTAENKLIAEEVMLAKDGTDNPELTELFKRPWFDQFLRQCLAADMWGYSVVEFGYMDENNEFISCKTFPRANIYPPNRSIILNETDTEGIPFGDNPGKLYLLELNEPNDLGLLELITKEVIWKGFARTDWATFSGKWGNPHLVIATEAEGDELDKLNTAAANFANNSYLVGDFDPQAVQLLESRNAGNGYLMFEKNIHLCDEQISKLINGQTGTSDNQAWAGTAEVHAEILDDYHHSRLRRYTNIINYKLIPFLISKGYPIEGCRLRFTVLDATQEVATGGALGNEGKPDPDPDPKKPKAALVPW